MELRHLRYFLAAADAEHFGQAAEKVHVAQSALSRRIADLEDEIGVALFSRQERRVRLTNAGHIFRDDVRDILERAARAVVRAQRAAAGQVGELVLGFVESAAWHGPVPTAFSAFRQDRPDVELSLTAESSMTQLNLIRSGALDGGFVYDCPVGDPTLTSLKVASEGIALAVPSGHPLALCKEVHVASLAQVPFVELARNVAPDFTNRIHLEFQRKGIGLNVVQRAQNDSSLLSLVAAGMGVGLVATTNRSRKPATVDLLPIKDLKIPIHLEFVWLKDNTSNLLDAFVGLLKKLPIGRENTTWNDRLAD